MKKYALEEKIKPDSFNLIVGIDKAKMPEFSKPKCYQVKIFKMGDIYEIYKYELPVYAGYHKFKKDTEVMEIKN